MKINILKKYQLRVYFSQIEKRQGVCSMVYAEDKHMLLWDFDHISLRKLTGNLEFIQQKYNLPCIYIIKTSISGYHAYCFTKEKLRKVIHILSDTSGIDMAYLRLGMVRGYYTLRFSNRENDSLKLVKILPSKVPEKISPLDITTNEYFTTNKGVKKNAKR